MAAAFKVDEDLPEDVANVLRDAGHDVRTVHDQGLSGVKDDALWPVVQAESRCLVTADKGFADARVHPPGSHAGIVLFRLPHESRAGYERLASLFVKSGVIDSAHGAITVVTPDAIRVHRK